MDSMAIGEGKPVNSRLQIQSKDGVAVENLFVADASPLPGPIGQYPLLYVAAVGRKKAKELIAEPLPAIDPFGWTAE